MTLTQIMKKKVDEQMAQFKNEVNFLRTRIAELEKEKGF